MKSFFFLTPILLLNLIILSPRTPALSLEKSVGLIEKTCKKTPYHDLCVSSLRSSPGSSNATVHDLAGTILNLTLANTTNMLSYIEALIDQTEDPQLERPLDYCAELYIPVVEYTLPQAIVAFDKARYRFAGYGVSDAGDQADKCEKEFSKSMASPLGDRNKLVSELCDVAVAIIKMLQ
ncbi:cell wall / vacuolar inhibitor of fructosidase 1-like [Rhodamnia argentea]|uniref:Cell wall / vacuolar inhibitor of fructosidase 1-like n=1 Tax=Rhodamnia argentea TaxID=178133 RepID=A0A8B8PYM4_9MYRT|nr:cell wall / vacuolar inhibitor of fructosidase 1-like [Rhodamnia argentea]